MNTRTRLYMEWFAQLPLKDRLRLVPSACCSNPNVVMDEDTDGTPIAKCANCGART
jgi:hypothetical protein